MKKIFISLVIISLLLTGCSSELEIKNTKSLSFTQSLDESFFRLEFDDYDYRDIVEPKNPSGYYHYFEEKDKYHYLVAYGEFKNISNETLNIDNINCSIELDGKYYDAALRLENKDRGDFVTEIQKDENLHFVLFALVPKKSNKEPSKVVLHYNEMLRKSDEDNKYDYETEIVYVK